MVNIENPKIHKVIDMLIPVTITQVLSVLSCKAEVITAPPITNFDTSNKYFPNSLRKFTSSFCCSLMTGTGTILVLRLFFIVKLFSYRQRYNIFRKEGKNGC